MDGWTPRTIHHYEIVDDDLGRRERLAFTQDESEWADPYQRAILDTYLNWRANLHHCGRPLTESLLGARPDIDEFSYAAGYQVCYACMALHQRQVEVNKEDKPQHERGWSPNAWRSWRVDLIPEAKDIYRAQHSD